MEKYGVKAEIKKNMVLITAEKKISFTKWDQTLRSITNYTLAESAKYTVGLFSSVVST